MHHKSDARKRVTIYSNTDVEDDEFEEDEFEGDDEFEDEDEIWVITLTFSEILTHCVGL